MISVQVSVSPCKPYTAMQMYLNKCPRGAPLTLHIVTLLLVAGSLFPQLTQGLKCSKCTDPKCSDDAKEDCAATETICMGMEFKSDNPLLIGRSLPITRGCFSAAKASCMGDTDNKCYPIQNVRKPCKELIEGTLREALKGFPGEGALLLPVLLETLDGKVCACNTDLCNNDLSAISLVESTPKSSGAVSSLYDQWITTTTTIISLSILLSCHGSLT